MTWNQKQKGRKLTTLRIEQQKEARKSKANQTYRLDHYIAILKQKIREGPYHVYICSVCGRIIHRKSVLILVKSKYNRNVFLQIQSPSMTKNIFVKPVIPKFQRETFLVKLCIIICMQMKSFENSLHLRNLNKF